MSLPSSSSLLRVDWLVSLDRSLIDAPGRVGLSPCPGRPDLGGTVEEDAAVLAALGISLVVTLVDESELSFYGVFGLRNALRQQGIASLSFPIRDAEPPDDLWATRSLCLELLRWLGEGHKLLIHCIGGFGRAGTIASALLTHEGLSAAQAIALVRKARSPRCVESQQQERFVERYAQAHKDMRRYYVVLFRSELPLRLSGEPGNRRLRRSLHPTLPLLSASALRVEVAEQIHQHDPSQLVIVSGETPAEQLHSDLDLPIDRALIHQHPHWQTTPLGQLMPRPERR
ncbi:MAG: hypothetical protein U0745_07870 [Polyangia bacterium]|mgnify:FL=1